MATLLPLAPGPAPRRGWPRSRPGSAWLALALATLLSLERLFERDYEDGALDLIALGPAPLELVAFGQVPGAMGDHRRAAGAWPRRWSPIALGAARRWRR